MKSLFGFDEGKVLGTDDNPCGWATSQLPKFVIVEDELGNAFHMSALDLHLKFQVYVNETKTLSALSAW